MWQISDNLIRYSLWAFTHNCVKIGMLFTSFRLSVSTCLKITKLYRRAHCSAQASKEVAQINSWGSQGSQVSGQSFVLVCRLVRMSVWLHVPFPWLEPIWVEISPHFPHFPRLPRFPDNPWFFQLVDTLKTNLNRQAYYGKISPRPQNFSKGGQFWMKRRQWNYRCKTL